MRCQLFPAASFILEALIPCLPDLMSKNSNSLDFLILTMLQQPCWGKMTPEIRSLGIQSIGNVGESRNRKKKPPRPIDSGSYRRYQLVRG